MRPTAALVLGLALALAGCNGARAPHLPNGIAALGDSIMRATNVEGARFGEEPAHAFATGADKNDSVLSHFERLKALDPKLDIVAFNDARSGAHMSDLASQATNAQGQKAEYVVVLMGANDICGATPVREFSGELQAAAATIAKMDAKVLLLSVPDVTQLPDLFKDNITARTVWNAYGICPRIFAEDADIAAERVLLDGYNAAIRAEASSRGWSYDGGAVHDIRYAVDDIWTVDYFHPSLEGQARLANVSWAASPYANWPR